MKQRLVVGQMVACLAVLTSLSAQSATFQASNTAELKARIADAKANGSNVDTIIFNGGGGWHSDGGEIRVDTPVIIDGVSPTTTLLYNANNQGGIFRLLSSNVTIKNFRIHSTKGAGQEGTIGVIFDGSNGVLWNVTISGNDFWQHGVGMRNSRGVLPKNLTVTNNRFYDTLDTAIGFGRDAGLTPDPLNGGKYTITNNWIRIDTGPKGLRGIILDNGNDGADVVNGQLVGKGVGNPVGSIEHSPKPTVYTEGSVVSGNTVLNAKRTAISFAKVSNIDIKNNTVEFINSPYTGIGAIHLEHRTERIRVENNKVKVIGAGYNKVGCINLSTCFYSGDLSFGTRAIWCIDNELTGDSWGLKGHGFSESHFIRNDFTSAAKVVTWSAQDAPNSIGQNWGNSNLPNGQVPLSGRVENL